MDKAQRFLDEMFPKLKNWDLILSTIPEARLWDTVGREGLKGELYSEVTGRFHPVKVRHILGPPEVALTVECRDLDCQSSRFSGVENIHMSFGSEDIHLVVTVNPLTGKIQDNSPRMERYRGNVTKALERNLEKELRPKRPKFQVYRERERSKQSFGQLELRLPKP